jgi:soluble lytic murein transglycosylase-like protein
MSTRRAQAVPFRVLRRREAVRRRALLVWILALTLLVIPQAVSAMESRQPQPAPGAVPATNTIFEVPTQTGENPTSRPPLAVAASLTASRGSDEQSLYERAGQRYGISPALLRALHQVESSGALGGCVRNLQGSGALGPLQFKPKTFWQYAVDADGDARPDICGLADSLFTAARYLRALGADADPKSAATQRALKRYGTDPARVVALATR